VYHAQFNEDAFLDGLFRKIGTTNKLLVDIGANDGRFCSNTHFFVEQGWEGIFVEPDEKAYAKLVKVHDPEWCFKEKITVENTIDRLLSKADFPLSFDLMSLDIDGQEYWVWQDMTRYRARVVVVEWSPYVQCDFIPELGSDGKDGYNQTGIHPMFRLALDKNYYVVAITPTNLICVDQQYAPERKLYWNGNFPL